MNEGASRWQEGSGAERRLERRSDEEEADNDERAGLDGRLNLKLMAWAEDRATAAIGESQAPAYKEYKR
jgi:hypothetical protein